MEYHVFHIIFKNYSTIFADTVSYWHRSEFISKLSILSVMFKTQSIFLFEMDEMLCFTNLH